MRQITVTASHVQQFRARSGNPHMIVRKGRVQVVGEDYYRLLPFKARLITTRVALAELDPEAGTYEPGMLAALLSDYATHLED